MHHTPQPDAPQRASTPTLDPRLLAIAMVAARATDLTVEEWLDTRIRACVTIDLSDRLEDSAQHLRVFMNRWILRNRRLIDAAPTLDAMCTQLSVDGPCAGAAPKRRKAKGRAIAEHVLYDEDAMASAQKRTTDKDLGIHFASIARFGPTRRIPVFDAITRRRVSALKQRAPHLEAATDTIQRALCVSHRMGGGLRHAPILLVWPPGSGKTWWARELAIALGLPAHTIGMPKVTASFVLSGSTTSWSQARPGRIVEAFMDNDCASPVFILDELDKPTEGNYSPAGVLLDLLETTSASQWTDEFFGCQFDVSGALFIATANHLDGIDPALRSRFCVIHVQAPTGEHLASVIQSAWASHLTRYTGLRLPRELPGHVVEGLKGSHTQVRELQRCFDQAIGRAASRPGALRLLAADFGLPAARLIK